MYLCCYRLAKAMRLTFSHEQFAASWNWLKSSSKSSSLTCEGIAEPEIAFLTLSTWRHCQPIRVAGGNFVYQISWEPHPCILLQLPFVGAPRAAEIAQYCCIVCFPPRGTYAVLEVVQWGLNLCSIIFFSTIISSLGAQLFRLVQVSLRPAAGKCTVWRLQNKTSEKHNRKQGATCHCCDWLQSHTVSKVPGTSEPLKHSCCDFPTHSNQIPQRFAATNCMKDMKASNWNSNPVRCQSPKQQVWDRKSKMIELIARGKLTKFSTVEQSIQLTWCAWQPCSLQCPK